MAWENRWVTKQRDGNSKKEPKRNQRDQNPIKWDRKIDNRNEESYKGLISGLDTPGERISELEDITTDRNL